MRMTVLLLLWSSLVCWGADARPQVASFNLLQGSAKWEMGEPRILPNLNEILSVSQPLKMNNNGFSYCNKLLTLVPHEVFTFTMPADYRSCLIYLRAPKGYLLEQRKPPIVWFAGCDSEQLRFTSGLYTMVYCDGGYQLNFHGDLNYVAIMSEGSTPAFRQNIQLTVTLKPEVTNLPGSRALDSGAREIVWRDPVTPTAPRPVLALARQDSSLQICPKTCGASNYDAAYSLVFGTVAEDGEVPYMAQVVVRYRTPGRAERITEVTCGGTILNSRHVLTAAHCLVDKDKESWRVHSRHVHTAGVDGGGEGQEIIFYKFVVHPDYNSQERFLNHKSDAPHDIAVVKLPEDLLLGPHSWPICLAPGLDFTNHRATISGFGQITRDDPESLWKAGVVIADYDEKCKKLDSSKGRNIMHQKMCTYGMMKDSCRGDPGSPVAVSEGSVWYQVGVAIDGFCGHPRNPHFFVNVTTYGDFIRQNVQDGKCH